MLTTPKNAYIKLIRGPSSYCTVKIGSSIRSASFFKSERGVGQDVDVRG
jgi:hypothetical protein